MSSSACSASGDRIVYTLPSDTSVSESQENTYRLQVILLQSHLKHHMAFGGSGFQFVSSQNYG